MITAQDIIEVVDAKKVGFASRRSGGYHESAYHLKFDSSSDMVRIASLGADRRDLHDFSYFYTDPHWIGRKFANFQDIIKSVEGTWPEGCDRVEEMSRELAREELPRPTVIKRRRVWDDYAGSEICVDRYQAGDPFFRDNQKCRASGPRVISLLVQLGQNSNMSSEDLFWRGALAVTVARIIEDAGYRAEIKCFATTKYAVENPKCPHILTSCALKGAGEALDVSSLVNVTSGWFFRTVMFASWTAPNVLLDSCLGSMQEATPEVVSYFAAGSSPWLISGVYSKESALKLARELLTKLVKEGR